MMKLLCHHIQHICFFPFPGNVISYLNYWLLLQNKNQEFGSIVHIHFLKLSSPKLQSQIVKEK